MDIKHSENIHNKSELMAKKIDATVDKCVESIYNVAKCAIMPDDPELKNRTLDDDALKLCLPDKQEIREYLEEKIYNCIDKVVLLTTFKKLHLVTFED